MEDFAFVGKCMMNGSDCRISAESEKSASTRQRLWLKKASATPTRRGTFHESTSLP
jgi:hypothetical protein